MSEKTEKPTQRKLREVRKRGDVPTSPRLTALAVYLGLMAFLWLAARYMTKHLIGILERAILAPGAVPRDGSSEWPWLAIVLATLEDAAWISGPLLVIAVACAVLVGGLQARGVFSFFPILPQFDRINPARGLRNLFSTRQLIELGKMLVKTALLAIAVTWSIQQSLHALTRMVYASVTDILQVSGTLVMSLMGSVAVVYVLGAGLDYAHQLYEFMKRQRMTVAEVRRDLRETEGDPHIKSQRRSAAYELLAAAMLKRVPTASVVVANPTHVCVALYYSAGETALPRVVAKGVGRLALRIRSAAREAGVPILEDPPLARKLFRDVALDAFITESLIEPTAAAVRWARQVDARAASAPAPEAKS